MLNRVGVRVSPVAPLVHSSMVERHVDIVEVDGSIPSAPTINIGMIVLLGSSYTRGAWGKDRDDPDAMLHTMLSKSLGCDVINMATPGYGSERFVDDYIYACKRFAPRLFLAEMVEDRSMRWLKVPNETTKHISSMDADAIYDMNFQRGHPREPYVTSDMDRYQIYNGGGDDPQDTEIMSGSFIQGFKLKELLRGLNNVRLFHEHETLWLMRTVKNFVSFEDLSSMVGVPVLYYKHTDYSDISVKLRDRLGDRFMNRWHGFEHGVSALADRRFGGKHLADGIHLTRDADHMVVNELMVPFINHHLTTSSI